MGRGHRDEKVTHDCGAQEQNVRQFVVRRSSVPCALLLKVDTEAPEEANSRVAVWRITPLLARGCCRTLRTERKAPGNLSGAFAEPAFRGRRSCPWQPVLHENISSRRGKMINHLVARATAAGRLI